MDVLRLRKISLLILFLLLFFFSIWAFLFIFSQRCLIFFDYITPKQIWEILKIDHKVLNIHLVTALFLLVGVIFYSIAFWKTIEKKTVLKLTMLWLSIILVTYWISLNHSTLESDFKVELYPISIEIMLPLLFSIIAVNFSYRLKWWVSIPLIYLLTGPSFILIDLIAFLLYFDRFAIFTIGYYGFHDYIFLFGLLGVIINVMASIVIIIGRAFPFFKRTIT